MWQKWLHSANSVKVYGKPLRNGFTYKHVGLCFISTCTKISLLDLFSLMSSTVWTFICHILTLSSLSIHSKLHTGRVWQQFQGQRYADSCQHQFLVMISFMPLHKSSWPSAILLMDLILECIFYNVFTPPASSSAKIFTPHLTNGQSSNSQTQHGWPPSFTYPNSLCSTTSLTFHVGVRLCNAFTGSCKHSVWCVAVFTSSVEESHWKVMAQDTDKHMQVNVPDHPQLSVSV